MNKTVSVISHPLQDFDSLEMPYTYFCLKSYYQRHGKYKDKWTWFSPFYYANYEETSQYFKNNGYPDILGFNCYIWNYNRMLDISKKIKEESPETLIVFGGPQPDYKRFDYFIENDFVDLVVFSEGEKTFAQILDEFYEKNTISNEIPGTATKENITPLKSYISMEDFNPYIDNKEIVKNIAEEAIKNGLYIWAPLETTRGCPYSCSFCDWGGGISTKVRSKTVDKVSKELELLSSIGCYGIFIADGNFGMLKRDIDITDELINHSEDYKYPKVLLFDTAKNQPRRIVTILEKLHKANLADTHKISIQDINETVLKNIKRSNISTQAQFEIADELWKLNIPTRAELIFGLPGQTRESFRNTLFTLFEMNIDDSFRVHPLQVLPNAEMGNNTYLNYFDMELKETNGIFRLREKNSELSLDSKAHFCVSSYSLSKEEWSKTWTEIEFITLMQGLMKFFFKYLHYHNYYSYQEIFEIVLDNLLPNYFNDKLSLIFNHYYSLSNGTNKSWEIDIEANNENFDIMVDPNMRLIYEFLLNKDLIEESIIRSFDLNSHVLKDLLNFNMNLLPSLDYDMRFGKSFNCDFDWMDYFYKEEKLKENVIKVSINDQRSLCKFGEYMNWCYVDDEKLKRYRFFTHICMNRRGKGDVFFRNFFKGE